MSFSKQSSVSHLEELSVVRIVILVLPSCDVHLVSVAGYGQLLAVVQRGRVQRVPIDETDQILFVVFPTEDKMKREKSERAKFSGKDFD